MTMFAQNRQKKKSSSPDSYNKTKKQKGRQKKSATENAIYKISGPLAPLVIKTRQTKTRKKMQTKEYHPPSPTRHGMMAKL